jgi:hypothetical protein
MKTLFTCFLLFFYFCSLSQQKESTVSISCYVNPELYLKGGVITFVSNRSGNFSCKGRYITIYNGSEFPFYYRLNPNTKTWIEVKPLKQVIIPVPSSTSVSSSLSVVRLYAKYREEPSNNISLKMKTIAKMNSESDKVKARELRGVAEKPNRVAQKSGKAATSKSIQTAKAKTRKVKETEQGIKKTPVKTSPPKEKDRPKLTKEKAPSVETITDTTHQTQHTIPSIILK